MLYIWEGKFERYVGFIHQGQRGHHHFVFRAIEYSLGGDLLERETYDEPGDPDTGDELWMVLCVDAIKGLTQAHC